MRILGSGDPLPSGCTRILVAGTSGAGKTTLAIHLAEMLELPRFEMDNLHWGPGWVTRPTFFDDVATEVAADAWITEWQYREARPILAERAQVMIWLDYSVARRMFWVTRRTVLRRVTRQPIWDSGLREKPLYTVFTDEDHIIRWAWRTRRTMDQLPQRVDERFPHLTLYRFASPGQARRWLRREAAYSASRSQR